MFSAAKKKKGVVFFVVVVWFVLLFCGVLGFFLNTQFMWQIMCFNIISSRKQIPSFGMLMIRKNDTGLYPL